MQQADRDRQQAYAFMSKMHSTSHTAYLQRLDPLGLVARQRARVDAVGVNAKGAGHGLRGCRGVARQHPHLLLLVLTDGGLIG